MTDQGSPTRDRPTGDDDGPVPATSTEPRWGLAEQLARPADHPASAILAAAARLFAERSPSAVSLREIAREAGVNYGLIHHYFRTKDAIVAAIFRQASDYGAERMASADDVEGALHALLARSADRRGPRPYAQMLTWTLLDSSRHEGAFTRSPAMARLQELLEEGWARQGGADPDGFDPRLVVAVVMLVLSTWPMFEPFLAPAAGLDERDPAEVEDELLALMASFAQEARTRARGDRDAEKPPA